MIKNKVNEVIKRYNTRDPYKIAEELDIILLNVHLKGINGFYHRYQDYRIIYLNEELSEREKEIVLAHELGHVFLHPHKNAIYLNGATCLIGRKFEIEADMFASELLINDEDILKNKNKSVEELAELLHVEAKHIEYKLPKLNHTED